MAKGAPTKRNREKPPTERDRRQHPRIRAFGHVHGRPAQLELSLELQDISAGGFSVESPIAFPLDTEFWFEFTANVGWAMLRAKCMHCVKASPLYGDVYFAGFRFVSCDQKDSRAITDLVNRVLEAVC